jgi:STE24 endopeptidase
MKIPALILFYFLGTLAINGQITKQALNNDPRFVDHFDPVKKTNEWMNRLPLAERELESHYTEGGHWLILCRFVVDVFICLLFIFGNVSTSLKKFSFKTSNRNWNNMTYIIFYFLSVYLISLPLNVYQNFIREKKYGFSNETFTEWFSHDLLKFLIGLCVATPVLVFIYARAFNQKEKWNARAFGLSLLLLLGFCLLYPVCEPLTHNQLTPVRYSLTPYTPDEVRSLFAHESGHYAFFTFFNFFWQFGLLFFICIIFVRWGMIKFSGIWGERLHISGMRDIAVLPLLIFLISGFLFISSPVVNTIMRTSEISADNDGLNRARDPDAFAAIILKSPDHNKADPGYWEEVFFYDKPCKRKRILNIMKWKSDHFLFLPFFDFRILGC